MGKSTISMAIFNSKLFVYQRVDIGGAYWFPATCHMQLTSLDSRLAARCALNKEHGAAEKKGCSAEIERDAIIG